jgi:hypothetical protein
MSLRNLSGRRAATSNLLPVGGVVSPLSLTGCAAWWDFSDAAYLATATNGTGTVSNGSAIAYCADRSGNARHITQATANNRPTWSSAGLYSIGAASCNGTTSFLATSASFTPWTGDQSFSWAAVFTRAAATSGWIASSAGTVGNNSNVLIADAYNASFSGNRVINYGGSIVLWGTNNQTTGTGLVISGYSSSGARNVSSFLRNGTQSHLTSQSATTSTLSASAAALEVGRGYAAGYQYQNGLLAEIAIYSRVLLAAELTSLTRYLGAKWGVTVA